MKIPDTIDVLAFAKNRQAGEKAAAEIERIGRKVEVFWNTTSRWDKFCIDRVKTTGYTKRESAFSCIRGHYGLLQKAVDSEVESVWIVEDDVRFLKDSAAVQAGLDSAPADADILLLDSWAIGPVAGKDASDYFRKAKSASNGWWKVENEDIRSAGDYIVGKRAIARYAEVMSRGVDGKIVRAADEVRNLSWFPGMNIYAAYPPLSIQQSDAGHAHMSSVKAILERYEVSGVDVGNYQSW